VQEFQLPVVPKHDIGALNLLRQKHLRSDTPRYLGFGEAFFEQASSPRAIGARDARDEVETGSQVFFEEQRDFDQMMSLGIRNSLLSQTSYLRMSDPLEEAQFSRITEHLFGDPTAIGPTVGGKTRLTPAGAQHLDGGWGLQDLTGQDVRIDDVEAEPSKAGGRRGLAAAYASRESDDHTPPYRQGLPRANLKQG